MSGSTKYTLLKSHADNLGSGGYGSVVRAKKSSTGEVVAAKVISTNRQKLSAIKKEVSVMALLSHSNIIALHDAEQIGNNFFIYMELAEGGELFTRVINSGSLSEPEALKYYKQLMSAVEHMHALGVVHRDLKLENILLDRDDNCKVCDFGLAHVYEKNKDNGPVLTRLYEVCGSKSYCAPEVLEGGGYDGFPTDIWSCGICLFAMLAGFFPLDEATGADWRFERLKMAAAARPPCSAARTIFGFYDRPCPLTSSCCDLIDGCLAIRPDFRLTLSQVASSPWMTGEPGKPDTMDIEPQRPNYRGGLNNLSREDIDAMYQQEKPPSPIYRGGPGRGPPPPLSKQACKFCAEFHLETPSMLGAFEEHPGPA